MTAAYSVDLVVKVCEQVEGVFPFITQVCPFHWLLLLLRTKIRTKSWFWVQCHWDKLLKPKEVGFLSAQSVLSCFPDHRRNQAKLLSLLFLVLSW